MDRPSRRGANKAAKAEAAGLALKNLREKGLKRMDTVDDLEDNDVYTTVGFGIRDESNPAFIRRTRIRLDFDAIDAPGPSRATHHATHHFKFSWHPRLPNNQSARRHTTDSSPPSPLPSPLDDRGRVRKVRQ